VCLLSLSRKRATDVNRGLGSCYFCFCLRQLAPSSHAAAAATSTLFGSRQVLWNAAAAGKPESFLTRDQQENAAESVCLCWPIIRCDFGHRSAIFVLYGCWNWRTLLFRADWAEVEFSFSRLIGFFLSRLSAADRSKKVVKCQVHFLVTK
jgi:hypothetical protein